MDLSRDGRFEALVLAAGNGDRFLNGSHESKLVSRVAGIPLIVRTLDAARRAGVRLAHVVVGYDAARVRAVAASGCPPGLDLHFHYNPDWYLENGVSVLAARSCLRDIRFALLMGDHLFDWRVLRALMETEARPGEALLGIDTQGERGFRLQADVAEEATKVRLRDGRVTDIGKTLEPYDGLDTGLFVCQPALFDAIVESCADGDTTLSGGVRRLAARGLVRGVDIGGAPWCDVDTVADLATAEALVQQPVAP